MYHPMKWIVSLSIIAWFALPAVATPQDLDIKVQLATQQHSATVSASVTADILALTSGGWKSLGNARPGQTLSFQSVARSIRISNLDGQPRFSEVKITLPHEKGQVTFNQKSYRGSLHLVSTGNGFDVRNTLPLEQYLYSVVPSEMPASWPLDALKSQAVAARTYALVDLKRSHRRGYDVAATTASQVYQGVKAEHPRSTQAVIATRGQVVTFKNEPIDAYFHSTSGGKTEFGGDLWANKPYLKPVKDVDQASPKYIWHTQFSQQQLQQLLQSKLQVNVGELKSLEPATRTRGGRVKTLRIQGTRGVKTVDGAKLRSALHLNSTFFNVGGINAAGQLIVPDQEQIVEIPETFEFAGRGWGHGMGMSQWGARQLALDGKGYREILKHYYQGVRVKKIEPTPNARRYKIASR